MVNRKMTIILLPLLFFGTVTVVLLAFEVGLRFGRWRSQQPDPEPQLPARMIITSVLSLLAFILGFTFNVAATHFDSRNQALSDEATAVGMAYRRTDLLSDPERIKVRALLREYVNLRLEAAQSGNVNEVIARLRRLQERIWDEAVEAGKKNEGPLPVTLMIQSLNDLIDIHAEKVVANMRTRIPPGVWVLLYLITSVAVAAAGYHSGLAGNRRRSYAALAYAFVFAGVIVMIADADSPKFGQFQVSHQSLIELRGRLTQNRGD
jgi:hypothetical protein